MARTKYTPERVDIIVAAIAKGMYAAHACALAGISEETYYTWLKNHPDFSEAVKRAEATLLQHNLNAIQTAADTTTSWQAAAWLLERRFPQLYGKTVQEQQGEQKLIIEHVNDWRKPGAS